MKMRGKRWLWLLTVLIIPVGYAGIALSGNLEPSGTPGSTMRTLEELQPSWSKKITDASKRFELVLDGAAVLDKETGLVWEKNPDVTPRTWSNAISYAYNKTVGGRKGWRLPTVEELASLVDTSGSGSHSLPDGHPFGGLVSYYWSSTTHVNDTSIAWYVVFSNGAVSNNFKSDTNTSVWCVRGAQGYDGQ
ncbi:MAG: hypothetical protein CV087_04890 [Candidatus Brocadia sp. WS118]|nr:MAG: hypothetical protein CV087_04890 [Candidatus Brocadia sp. WS118]